MAMARGARFSPQYRTTVSEEDAVLERIIAYNKRKARRQEEWQPENHFWARSHFSVAVLFVLILFIDMPPGSTIIIIFMLEINVQKTLPLRHRRRLFAASMGTTERDAESMRRRKRLGLKTFLSGIELVDF